MTTPTLREAAAQALAALATCNSAYGADPWFDHEKVYAAREAVRAALAQPVPDAIHWPQVVAYPGGNGGLGAWVDISTGDGPEHVQRFHAAAHPQPAPQPLTDERILNIAKTIPPLETCEQEWLHFAHRLLFAAGIVPAPTTGEGQ